ncbi:Orf9, involved in biosynthesis of tetrahydromethanopterin [Methyloversatilis universalis FAM5]|uniref:Orf9, involved in biosynthesis of tetrahydromethanopterin n=1 Tax=Methyloversatilis universalis (strain ATCC BAA-1314 / DSM 25237 / JCM 13912 / CCUG 52030 / FAM5) TaxID=1000565 RepID=F5RB37_METUF|nr:hydantoinase/oxoprolinase family protein [Methyloversatilis universalis]EGK72173.1 Orf9, involved in biosynthesis of tetrahydromethanopterin [Methyloversatilis universalis FAM5]
MSAVRIGWDIGGAHVKAARVIDGQVSGVVQVACPLWQGLDRLDAAVAEVLSVLGEAPQHAITMTGEMTDLFASRADGVAGIAQRMRTRLRGDIALYAGRAGWAAVESAHAHADDIASANWLATAAWIATRLPQALLADIGSTTSDLIVIDGGVATASRTDADRLISGELVYAGVVRTPLMALASAIEFRGRRHRLMAEYFATSADVWRLLGELPDHADQYPAADGGAKTPEACARRLARMIGRDLDEGSMDDWRALAAAFANAQLGALVDACRGLPGMRTLAADAPVVCAGAGRFVAARLARALGRPTLALGELLRELAPDCADDATTCAPAVAVALLATDAG